MTFVERNGIIKKFAASRFLFSSPFSFLLFFFLYSQAFRSIHLGYFSFLPPPLPFPGDCRLTSLLRHYIVRHSFQLQMTRGRNNHLNAICRYENPGKRKGENRGATRKRRGKGRKGGAIAGNRYKRWMS